MPTKEKFDIGDTLYVLEHNRPRKHTIIRILNIGGKINVETDNNKILILDSLYCSFNLEELERVAIEKIRNNFKRFKRREERYNK